MSLVLDFDTGHLPSSITDSHHSLYLFCHLHTKDSATDGFFVDIFKIFHCLNWGMPKTHSELNNFPAVLAFLQTTFSYRIHFPTWNKNSLFWNVQCKWRLQPLTMSSKLYKIYCGIWRKFMNLINMNTKIFVWKFAVQHLAYMHVAMVTVTVVWTFESIWFITCRCSSYECIRCEVFVKMW